MDRFWCVRLSEVIEPLSKVFSDLTGFKFVVALSMGLLSFVLPDAVTQGMGASVLVLIFLDTITGVAASFQEGERISSKRFRRVLSKLVGYGSVLIVVAIADRYVLLGALPGSATISAILTLVLIAESVSILENVKRMGLSLPFGLDRLLADRLRQSVSGPALDAQEDASAPSGGADR